jgi:hypothetical protein
LWGYSLNFTLYLRAQYLGAFLILINFASSIADICDICIQISTLPLYYLSHLYSVVDVDGDIDNWKERNIGLVTALVQATSLLLFSLLLLVFGLITIQKLKPSSTTLPLLSGNSESSLQIHIWTRINSVLVVCTACYLLRVWFITVLVYESLRFGRTAHGLTPALSNLVWFIVTFWIPSLGPVNPT